MLLENNKKKKMKIEKDDLLLAVLALKDDQEFMDLINSVTFTYSTKYKQYSEKRNKPSVEVEQEVDDYDSY